MSTQTDRSAMVRGSAVEFVSQSGDKELDSKIEDYLNQATKHFVRMKDHSQPPELPFSAENIHVGDKIYVPNDEHVVIVEVTNRHIIPSAVKPTLMIFVEPVNEPVA